MNVKQEDIRRETLRSAAATILWSFKKHLYICSIICIIKDPCVNSFLCFSTPMCWKHCVADPKHAWSAKHTMLILIWKSPVSHTLRCPPEAFSQEKLTKAKQRKCLSKMSYSLPKWPVKIHPPAALLLFRQLAQSILSHYIFLILRALWGSLKKGAPRH